MLTEIPTNDAGQTDPVARLMTPRQVLWSIFTGWLVRCRRRLPYLVWWNDELDVVVTFSQEKLDPDGSPEDGLRQLFASALADVEAQLRVMGVEFDRGIGFDGRDWEWDWSLKGPISVRFHGRASKPERRRERPKPRLAVNNAA